MKTAIFLAALAASVALSAATCFPKCKFTFCYGGDEFKLGPPDVAFTGPICRYGVQVGHIDETREAYVDRYTPISHFRPYGLSQPYSPSVFKSYGVGKRDRSGIGHETFQGNQEKFLDGICVAVPIGAYQVLGKDGNVIDNIHPTDYTVDCVAFRVKGRYH